ncbi:hypothetical protein FBY04_10591 [Pseudomonas sp. SJZ080]|uniref:hypothetical protein n=1 Tax=Pseudomonas sp. SJZ080 TaxID=2572888 RepID=UPI001198F660|nr:hypothetical protein [Pseudomonas sp. SJZ080]TWC57621.1 hypothetical protein FBY04_10591 [Pseudomonas sp. SJZ080]
MVARYSVTYQRGSSGTSGNWVNLGRFYRVYLGGGFLILNKEWRDIEKLARAIEQSVSPGASVQHNVNLPHVDSISGATSQCDIVITEGGGARTFTTIVEVQSRNVKVKVGEFLGWLGKRKLVGADKLVCVSRKGFSSTIKELAAKEGKVVVLVMLHELDPSSLPMNFISFHLQYRHFILRDVLNIRAGISRVDLDSLGIRERFYEQRQRQSRADAKEWSLDGISVITLEALIRESVDYKEDFSGVSRLKIEFDSEVPLYTFFEGAFIRAAIDVEFDYLNRFYSVPMSTLAYEQLEHGVLGWVMVGDLKTDYGDLAVKIPIYQDKDGIYSMKDEDVIVSGMEGVRMHVSQASSEVSWCS